MRSGAREENAAPPRAIRTRSSTEIAAPRCGRSVQISVGPSPKRASISPRQERDYQGTLRAGSDYGWREEDRYQENRDGERGFGRDYGQREYGQREFGGGYGAESYGGAYGSREHGGGWDRSGRSRESGGSG